MVEVDILSSWKNIKIICLPNEVKNVKVMTSNYCTLNHTVSFNYKDFLYVVSLLESMLPCIQLPFY